MELGTELVLLLVVFVVGVAGVVTSAWARREAPFSFSFFWPFSTPPGVFFQSPLSDTAHWAAVGAGGAGARGFAAKFGPPGGKAVDALAVVVLVEAEGRAAGGPGAHLVVVGVAGELVARVLAFGAATA